MEEHNEQMPSEKLEAPEVASQSKLVRWLENFWYHYKWQSLLAGFILLTLIVCLVQCSSSNEKSDITLTFGGSYSLTAEQRDAVISALESALPEDYDGSGDKAVAVSWHLIHNEEQLRALNTYIDAEGKEQFDNTGYELDKGYNADRYQTLQNFVMTGESGVWLVSPYVYQELLYSNDPRSNWVKASVPLKETAFYAYYEVLKALPEDTLVVLTVQPAIGAMRDDVLYSQAEAYYQAILNFTPPQ